MFTIRPLRYLDIYDGFLDLIEGSTTPSEAWPIWDYISVEIKEGRRFTWIAANDDKIVGTVTLSVTRGFADGGRPKGFVNDLSVKPDYRKQGIGEALMNALKEEAKLQGCTHITLACSDKNLKWYEKLGFAKKYYHMSYAL